MSRDAPRWRHRDLATPALLIGKEAREQSVEGSIIPVSDTSDQVTGLVLLRRDVTGQARMTEERNRAQAMLERSEQPVLPPFHTSSALP